MEANIDKTVPMSTPSKPDQQPVISASPSNVKGKMKAVNCAKTGKMGLDGTGSSSLKGQKNHAS